MANMRRRCDNMEDRGKVFDFGNFCGKHLNFRVDPCTARDETWSRRFAVAVHRNSEKRVRMGRAIDPAEALTRELGERVMANIQIREALRGEGEARLAELILYISQKCVNDPKFGATKLNKILYFADFMAYGTYGRPITGVPYCHREMGPAPQRLRLVRRYLEANRALIVQKKPLREGREQHRTIALRNPDLRDFPPDDIAMVDGMIKFFWDLDAEDSSELSHQMVGWNVTEMNEVIPYRSIFFSDPPLTAQEEEYAQTLVKRGLERGLPVG